MEDWIGAFGFLIAVAAIFAAVTIASRRYAARKEREGAWDERGPRDVSLPPPEFLQVYPRPWGIQRPTIEGEEEEANQFLYPIERKPEDTSHE